MTDVEQRVLDALGSLSGASPWQLLLSLYRSDAEAFYLLACDGVYGNTDPRVSELADLARQVRDAVRGSYQIETSQYGAHLVGPGDVRAFIPPNLVESVRVFLLEVDGKGIQDVAGGDYVGRLVTEAEIRFRLGDRATWETEHAALEEERRREPPLLGSDAEDIRHL